MAIAKVTTKGQVTIPAETRKALGIEEGDDLMFEVMQEGEARLKVIKRARISDLYGALPATRPYPGKKAIRNQVGRHLGEHLSGHKPRRKKRG